MLKLSFGCGVSFEKIACQLSWQGSGVLLLGYLRMLKTLVFYSLMLLKGAFSSFGWPWTGLCISVNFLSLITHFLLTEWKWFSIPSIEMFKWSSIIRIKSLRRVARAPNLFLSMILLLFQPNRLRLSFVWIVVFSSFSFHKWDEISFLLIVTLRCPSVDFLFNWSDWLARLKISGWRARLFALNLETLSRPASSLKYVRLRVFWVILSRWRWSPRSWSPSELWPGPLLVGLFSVSKATLVRWRFKVQDLLVVLVLLVVMVFAVVLVEAESLLFVESGRALFKDGERLVEGRRWALEVGIGLFLKLRRPSRFEGGVSLKRH